MEWYLENGIETIEQHSPHAVTVPGAIDAWSKLLTDHGTMSLGDLLQPAIGYARDGAPVNHRQSHDWKLSESLLSNDPTSAAQFLVDGKAPELGTRVKLPLLA